MGYHDYWDGDCEMARYYRDMDEKVKERQNEALWLQGLYFYEALVDASPVLNAMSKKHKPMLTPDSKSYIRRILSPVFPVRKHCRL